MQPICQYMVWHSICYYATLIPQDDMAQYMLLCNRYATPHAWPWHGICYYATGIPYHICNPGTVYAIMQLVCQTMTWHQYGMIYAMPCNIDATRYDGIVYAIMQVSCQVMTWYNICYYASLMPDVISEYCIMRPLSIQAIQAISKIKRHLIDLRTS